MMVAFGAWPPSQLGEMESDDVHVSGLREEEGEEREKRVMSNVVGLYKVGATSHGAILLCRISMFLALSAKL